MEADGNSGRSRLDRLLGRVDSWQKAVIAVTALLVAIGGLLGAGLGVWREVSASGPTPPTGGPSQTPPASQNPIITRSTTAAPSSSTQSPMPPGKQILPPTEYDLAGFRSLTYDSASGPQTLLTYYDVTNELLAGASVSLAVLDPPAPTTPYAGYARCQGPTTNTDTILPGNLKPDSTLCAFTPNNQVFWIKFLPPDPNSQSSALRLTVAAWQY